MNIFLCFFFVYALSAATEITLTDSLDGITAVWKERTQICEKKKVTITWSCSSETKNWAPFISHLMSPGCKVEILDIKNNGLMDVGFLYNFFLPTILVGFTGLIYLEIISQMQSS